MPITVNGVPLVSQGAVNRQIIGTMARQLPLSYFELHSAALQHAARFPLPQTAPEAGIADAIRAGLRRSGFVA